MKRILILLMLLGSLSGFSQADKFFSSIPEMATVLDTQQILTSNLGVWNKFTAATLRNTIGAKVTASAIAYVPTLTGNVLNLNEFVTDTAGDVWFIDVDGEAIKLKLDKIGFSDFDTDVSATMEFAVGAYLDAPDVTVTSNGATVLLNMEKEGGGDIQVIFSTGVYVFDATPIASIALTAGTDTSPTNNFIYILESTKALTVSTSGWPVAEFSAVATVLCQSAVSVQNIGAYKVHVWTDHMSNGNGHLFHINKWIRWQPATWLTGVDWTLSINTTPSPDDMYMTSTAGTVSQLHTHTFPAFTDTTTFDYLFVNHPTAYTKANSIGEILVDALGGSLSGQYYTFVIWGVVSEDTGDSHLMVNLPTGSYGTESAALADNDSYTVYDIPVEYTGTAFLIAEFTVKHATGGGGTFTSIRETDLRGKSPSAVSGGGGVASTDFQDDQFSIYDNIDPTKAVNFEASGIATGTTRTLTVPDESGTIALEENRTFIKVANYSLIAGQTAANGKTFWAFDTDSYYKVQATEITEYTTDEIAVHTLAGGNFAALLPKNGKILTSFLGVVDGSICTDIGCTNTTQETTNWTLYKKAHQYAQAIGANVIVDAAILEMAYPQGDSILVQNLIIEGLGREETRVELFPKNKTNVNSGIVYKLNDGSNITLENIYFKGDPFKLETYNSIATVAGDATKVQITDATVRAALSADIVGKNIWVTVDDVTLSEAFTVSSYDSGTKTITLSGSLSGIFTTDIISNVGIEFQSSHSISDFETYGTIWFDSHRESTLVSYVNGGNTDNGSINLINFKTTGFYEAIERSGGAYIINVDNSIITAGLGIQSFSGDFAIDSKVVLNDSEITGCGFDATGFLPGSWNFTSGGVYGAGGYLHPNVRVSATNTDFYDNFANGWQNYSSSGDKPVLDKWYSIYDNCKFYGNTTDDYSIQTSESLPTIFNDCYFENGNRLNNTNTFNNCTFNNSGAIGNSDTTIINLNNCTFVNDSYVFNEDRAESEINVKGGTFEVNTNDVPDRIFRVGLGGIVNVKDATIIGNGYVFGDVNPNTIIINNLQCDSCILFRSFAPISIFDKVEIKNSDIFQIGLFQESAMNTPAILSVSNTKVQTTDTNKEGYNNYEIVNNANPTVLTPVASVLTLDPFYNSFKTKGTVKSALFGTKNGSSNYTGNTTFIADSSDIIITAFDASTNNTSNFTFDETISTDDKRSYFYDSKEVLYTSISSQVADVIDTTSTSLTFTSYNNITNKDIVPSTLVVTIGAVTFTDWFKDGTLQGSDGSTGFINYTTNYIVLFFDSAPVSGTNVSLDYDYYVGIYFRGAWKKETGGSSLWTQIGSDIYYNTGKVFLGQTTGVATLDIKGTSGTQGLKILGATTNSFNVHYSTSGTPFFQLASSANSCGLFLLNTIDNNWKNMIIRAKSGQAASIFEWQDSGSTVLGSITAAGNIELTGTVDGYDVSVMGVKLAGIPSNATAPQALSSVISVGDAGGAKVENIGAATVNTDAVQFVQMKPQNGTGSPSGSVTPRWIGDFYVDTTGASEVMWMSYGTANTNWKQISN